MSAQTRISLTAHQRKLLAESLVFFEKQVKQRGSQLFARQAVREVSWAEPDVVLLGEVQGSKLYSVTLEFGQDGIETSCTCPYEIDCKHAVALIFHLQVKSVTINVPQTKAKKAPKPAPPPIAQPAEDSFPGRAAALLGSTLTAAQVKFLQQAAIWWVGKQNVVAQQDLFKLCGRQSYWGYGQVQLWPTGHPPADETEFFACLSAALHSCDLALPSGLSGLVAPAVQERLIKKWQRLQQIDDWRKRLGSWQEPQLHLATEAPELRLMLHAKGALIQVRHPGEADFGKASQKLLKQFWGGSIHYGSGPNNLLSAGSNLVLKAAVQQYGDLRSSDILPFSDSLAKSLGQLISTTQLFQSHVVTLTGDPLPVIDEPLRWDLQPPAAPGGDYELRMFDEEGHTPPPPLAIVPGFPLRYVTHESVFAVNYWPFGHEPLSWPVRIPAAALETKEGVSALSKLGVPVPQRLEGRVKIIRAEIEVRCKLYRYPHTNSSEYLHARAQATFGGVQDPRLWTGMNWTASHHSSPATKLPRNEIVQIDSSLLPAAGSWLAQWPFKLAYIGINDQWLEQRIQGKDWPEQFLAWLDRRPKGLTVELDAELASLRDGKVAGHVRLDIEESKTGIDWFDLSIALDVSDSTLTQEEIDLLLKAKGKWVRLPGKGWRKLEYQLTEAQLQELAELGLAAHDFSAEKQRLHALQLGGLAEKNNTLLSAERVAQVRRRVEEIQTRVTPPLPEGITATLRPYQTEGFHFLAYLTANRFGGVLADDMGLGKTLQTLAWIAWLRGAQQVQEPMLVICPKSVQDNWRGEVARFFPQLTVEVWNRASAGKTGLGGTADLLIIHYAQLRIHEDLLKGIDWGAVILDEAQAIKNPTSQNSQAACGLNARHRLALTGTPIENRLLDLWSIFAFAMPGVLGTRAAFTKNFDGRDDPLARRRLAARTRPFLLRRTKNEVARDLPDRVEEDLSIELEGTQAALYQAEVKRARAQLLKAETSQQLDKLRFNILTSLLRLRQICCHPRLLGLDASDTTTTAAKKGRKKAAEPASESAKVTALMELLEPLMEEGQKVLVFSQFVEMLDIIEAEIQERGWRSFKLTGQTEERGALVNEFQTHTGAATFLISLKAGGFGLNLTAASYVVLFDPWWNPAVEAQAIDRTHRIGQKQTVFAYRLIVKNSIEEKIRHLQKQKGALANDILGEENFAQALTLNDFRFLLGGEE
ncbi:DEAD/DEAH box helicase [Prosthecobacter sp.]|uniref:DEAD/DEAH box helicase n=1 Tax=Prosthecobacter sp. TaxID=1965333 RepID=UPI0024875E80|nr:DEAD/DEAH box helicase [Prosthecobacter sp.]MDI1311699.1 DEAD/DEAH box helicase [Prosthecobacter sp.]